MKILSNIELNVIATGNFGQLEAQLKSLQAQVVATNKALSGSGKALNSREMASLTNAFHESVMASGQFTSKLVSLSTAAEHLGQRLQKSKTTMQDYKQAISGVSKESNLYNQLAQRQVALQNSVIQTLGNGMARVYAQHKVDLTDSAMRQQVLTKAIIAQNTALKQGATKIINWGKNTQWAGRQLTAGLTMPIAMFSAGLAKMYNEVDVNLTKMAKVYGVGVKSATDAQIASIRGEVMGLAKDLGKQLGISASEVTDTAAQLAAAGLQGKELLASTAQASRMVVLGEADKQEAIKATIALQTAYKLNTTDLTEAVNFFNAAQAATSTSMADLIEAVPRVGPVVRGLGGSYKDMVAIVTALKEGGVPAGEAANAIKTSLGRIINPTEKAKKTMKGFGIDIEGIVNKNAGNLIGTLTELQSGLDSLSSLDRQRAIAELFGKFQFARMTALMDNFGKTGTQSAKVLEMMGMSASELATIADEQTKKIQQSASGRFKIAVETMKNTLMPFGESALNLFSTLIEKLTGFFDTLNDIPGPFKTLLKAIGMVGVVAGPIIMLTGLFGNLLGSLLKGTVNFKSLIVAVSNGVNPLKVFGKQLQLDTEESIAAARAEDLLGDSMKKNLTPVEIMTRAIEEQTAALQKLMSAQNSITSLNSGRTSSMALVGLGPTSNKKFTDVLSSHYFPFSQMSATKGEEGVLGAGGREGSARGVTTVGTTTLQKGIGTTVNDVIGKKMTILVKGYEEEVDILKREVASKLEASHTQEQINDALQRQFLTEEESIRLEASNKAARMIMTDKTSQTATAISERNSIALKEINAASKSLSGEALKNRLLEISGSLQTDINAMLSADADYLTYRAVLESEFNDALAQSTTREERLAAYRTQMQKYYEEELIEVRSMSDNLKTGVGATGRLNQSLRLAAEGATEIPIVIDELTAQLVSEVAEAEQIVQQGSGGGTGSLGRFANLRKMYSEGSAGKGRFGGIAGGVGNVLKQSPGIKFGAGMGIAIGGSMISDMLPEGTSGKQSLSMASQGAGIGMLFGPEGALIGAALGGVVGALQEFETNLKKSAAGLQSTLGATKEEFKALGIEISPLDTSLPGFNNKLAETVTAVDAFRKSIQEAADTSEMKQFVEQLKQAGANQSKIDEMVAQKARSLAFGGATKEQVQTAIAAYLQEAGLSRTNFDVASLFGQNGQVLSTVAGDAVRNALRSQGVQAGSQYQGTTVTEGESYLTTSIDYGTSKQVGNAANALKTSLEGLISTNTPLETFLATLKDIDSLDFAKGTNGGEALSIAMSNLVAEKPQLKSLYNSMLDSGMSSSDMMLRLRAAVAGVGDSIENLPRMTNVEIQVLLNQQAIANGTGLASTLANQIASKSQSGSGSSGSGASTAIDNKIKKYQALIDKIKEEQDIRKKIEDSEKRELEYSKQKLNLQNQLRSALASGNLLAAAEARQAIEVADAQKAQEDAGIKATDAADARIKELEDKIKKLEEKKSKQSGGGSGGGNAAGKTVEQITQEINDAEEKTMNLVNANSKLIKTYDNFIKSPEVKKFNEYLKKQGATPQQIAEENRKMWLSYKPTVEAIKGSQDFSDEVVAIAEKLRLNLEDPKQYATAARLAVDAIKNKLNEAKLSTTVEITPKMTKNQISFVTSTKGKNILDLLLKADGGYISGPGTSTSDSIPAMLSNGEYVINAGAVSKYGLGMFNAINAKRFASGGYVVPGAAKMAGGGMVSSINATFNITGDNPQEIAQEVMKIMDKINRRSQAVTRIG